MGIEDDFSHLRLRDHKEHENSRILDKFADQIKTDELKLTKGKTSKDKANRATVENVLDPRTMRFLRKLINRGVISEFNGCLSTGKEANVYHAFAGDAKEHLASNEGADHAEDTEDAEVEVKKKEYAIKIYKTSILVFKDRERYVDGEFRFRNARSQHNPRKMIKVWAEKEFRNLKRIYQSEVLPCPKPIEIKSNVLVMEFLGRGDGFASPKLRDYPYKDRDEIYHYYHLMLSYIRLLYQECQLVHADLSEYNTIVHEGKLYMIDVSQSVQPEHPMSLDFLRMDIKNVNGYFSKMGIDICPERAIFQFVISESLDKFEGDYRSYKDLQAYVKKNLPLKLTNDDEVEDEVFRSLHLVRNLDGLEERDFERFTTGKFDLLKSLIAEDNKKVASSFTATEQYDLTESDSEDSDDSDESDNDSSDSNDDSDSDGEDSESDEYSDERHKELKGKKHEDKDAKKLRKQETKEAKRERRKTKVKKHLKKKLVKKTKSKK
ncbi:HFL250Wp [Eremothecium sinecaudum]|uniref:Serine/threonine-protein kinase RIO1 n=1 Tax=Eremothecium sinecaudum TaxID=45286 RepID=A0A0X8HUB6_9SACH|nr:HFL250Wp [Eremothecium sinecaudum]AMD21606.1 HFL250Wp [Eremothecium sinecaudum]